MFPPKNKNEMCMSMKAMWKLWGGKLSIQYVNGISCKGLNKEGFQIEWKKIQ